MREWDTVVDFDEYVKALQRSAEAPVQNIGKYGVKAVVGSISNLNGKVSQHTDVEERYVLLFRLASMAAWVRKHADFQSKLDPMEKKLIQEIGGKVLTEVEDLQENRLHDVYEKVMVEARARQEERMKKQEEDAKILEIKQQREAEMEKRRKEAEAERERQDAERRAQEQRERQEKQEYWRALEAKQKQEVDRLQQERYAQWRKQEEERQQKLEQERAQQRERERLQQEKRRRLFWSFNAGPPVPANRIQQRRGLVNLGNTCYMNSVLQALFGSPLATAFLHKTKELEKDLNILNQLGFSGRVAGAFFQVISEMNHPASYPVQPRNFKQIIGECNSSFKGYEQQDSHDFMRTLLDGLHEDLNRIKQRTQYLPDIDSKGRADEEVAAQSWEQYKMNNDSVLVDMFAFMEKSRLICPRCGAVSTKFSPMMSLEVPIPQGSQMIGLDDCLQLHVREETLDADSLWECGGCKAKVQARKKLDLWSAPQVLIISLKRFQPAAFLAHSYANKVTKEVYFPQHLDMTEYLPFSDTTVPYELFAIINHEGTMNGGHYTAEVKGRSDGVWFWFSDERYQRTESYKPTQAYQLLYRRTEGQPRRRPGTQSALVASPSSTCSTPTPLPPSNPPISPSSPAIAMKGAPIERLSNGSPSSASTEMAPASPAAVATPPADFTQVPLPQPPGTHHMTTQQTSMDQQRQLQPFHATPAAFTPSLPSSSIPSQSSNLALPSALPYMPSASSYAWPSPPPPSTFSSHQAPPSLVSPPQQYAAAQFQATGGSYIPNGHQQWANPSLQYPPSSMVPNGTAFAPSQIPPPAVQQPPAPEVDLLQFDTTTGKTPQPPDPLDAFFNSPTPHVQSSIASQPSLPLPSHALQSPCIPNGGPVTVALPTQPQLAPQNAMPPNGPSVAGNGHLLSAEDQQLQEMERELRRLEQEYSAQVGQTTIPQHPMMHNAPPPPEVHSSTLSSPSNPPPAPSPPSSPPAATPLTPSLPPPQHAMQPSDPGAVLNAMRTAADAAEQRILKLRFSASIGTGKDGTALQEEWRRLNEELINMQIQLDAILSQPHRVERKKLIDRIHDLFQRLDTIKMNHLTP